MKSLDQLTAADERYSFFAILLEQIHEDLQSTTLYERVPSDVREIFDTAKSLSLYSWFVYEFNAVAMLTGFLALEKAVRARAEIENYVHAGKPLRKVMNHALDCVFHGYLPLIPREACHPDRGKAAT